MYFSTIFKELYKTIIVLIIGVLFSSVGYSQTCDQFAQDAEPGDIIITEVFTRSNGNIPDYIEIYNRSLFSHCLLNWKISIFGTEYVLDNEDISVDLNLSPSNYMIITGQDGYFSDENNTIYLAAGDQRVIPESDEYNAEFASFVFGDAPNYTYFEDAVWAPFSLSHSASLIEIITDLDVIVDRLNYNSTDYQIGGNYIGHSIEITNDIPEEFIGFEPLQHLPSYWSYSKHSRPAMFTSDELYSMDNLFMEFGSPAKRNYLNSVITVTNLQCGDDPLGNEFCHAPGTACVSQSDEFNNETACEDYHGDDNVGDYWELFQNSQIGLCWYDCVWSDTPDYVNMDLENPLYNIYHDRYPGGTKSLMFDADQSDSNEGDDIVTYKWYKNGNVFQNGIHIESEFAEGAHELVLLVKNDDDIWAVDTFNFEIKEPNIEPTPIISVDATEYVVRHNGEPSPTSREITLSGVNSCDCNDYIRYEFYRNGAIITDEECDCIDLSENPSTEDFWMDYLIEECEGQGQDECESEEYSDFCRWEAGIAPDFIGSCEYSEIEYFFWTKDGEIQGTSKEFVTNVPDIGEYVFSLILTDTYGENNSESTNITVSKEYNYPPIANIVGETTITDFTPSNGIPYDMGELDLQTFDASYDNMLEEGQDSEDPIFSQWYTIEGEAISSDDTAGDAHKTDLSLGSYTFILEVLDSYNCYSKNDYNNYLNNFEICYGLDYEGCDIYSSCRWFENECTPYCELYAQGFCDGAGTSIGNDIPCHKAGVNEDECGVGGSCIFNDEYCESFNNEIDCNEQLEPLCTWNTSNGNGVCQGSLQSADYDTLTVILSEENSPPIADIGTNHFHYLEGIENSISSSVYDIEFYNLGNDTCYYDFQNSDLCDPTIPPLFETREEKCCIQVEWEVVASHYGSEEFIDDNNDNIDDNWDFCADSTQIDIINHPYCNETWIFTPNDRTLSFEPPENEDFYPDSVRLRLTATDPFYNTGISELFGQDEVVIIIDNDNQPPELIVDFDEDGYNIIEDDEESFLEFNLNAHFDDNDGEDLNFNYYISNGILIDDSVIELDDNGYIANGILNIQNNIDINGDTEFFIYASDSEYTINTSFIVRVIPKNDIPNIYSVYHDGLIECTENCETDVSLNPFNFVLAGDAGGCGENNNPDNCENGTLTYDIIRDSYYGWTIPRLEVTNEVAYNYFPFPDFFGYDSVFFQITDIGTSAGDFDTLTSDIGYIVFHVEKGDNDAPIVQRKDFTIKEDYLIHFTVNQDSIIYVDSLNHVYVGLDVLDDDNNCAAEFNDDCNDPLYNLDNLSIEVQSSSEYGDFFELSDTNLSVIELIENYNDSLVITIVVKDFEFENNVSNEDSITINLIPVNDKPISENLTYQFDEDEMFEFELMGEDFEGDLLSYEVIKLPTKLDTISPDTLDSPTILFDFGETPTIQFTPLNDFNGLDSLIYIIHDDGTTNYESDPLTSDSIIVEFDILPINDPPRIDSVYFESDTLLYSLIEDTSNVRVYMIYTDIDADEELNNPPSDFDLTWVFNTSDNEDGLKFWFKEEDPIIVDEYTNPLRKVGIFTIDSLLANWNGTDTSIIKITDDLGHVENYKFGLTVEPINDPPTISKIYIDTAAVDTLNNWEYEIDDNAEVILAEDSKNIPIKIEYFDIDTDTNLNVDPDTIAGFSWDISSLTNKLFASYRTIFDEESGKDIFEFSIDSIAKNWNGYDNLITVITDTLGDSYIDILELQVFQVNDSPEPFNYYSMLNNYPINDESNNFYINNNSWTYRLPYQESPITEEKPEEVLIKWKRTTDIDLVDSLNNHQNSRIEDLFYRVELEGDKSGYTYVIEDRINDSLFNDINYCQENLEITPDECLNLGITDNSFGFTKIDLTKTFLAYKGAYYDSLNVAADIVYKELDRSNDKSYYCNDGSGIQYGTENCNDICPETCSNTDYKLNIVAYNANNPDDSSDDLGYDYQLTDSPQYADVFDGDSANFNIDLILPEFQFNVIRNDIFWEYYDLYITDSEPILDEVDGSDYKPLLIIEYANDVIDTVDRTSSAHGPIHYTSKFLDEDSITFIYSARDFVENYGTSSKIISYAIVEPTEKSIVSTPSQNSQLTFEIGSVNEYTGVIAEDLIINNLNENFNNGIGVSFLPENQPIVSSIKLSFDLNLLGLPNGSYWKYELYKKIGDNWTNLNVRFEKVNGILNTQIEQLGQFIVLYNEDSAKPIPLKFVLYPNYPNPFNGSTTIKFEIPTEQFIKLNIINILGENVKSIFKGNLNPDFYKFVWDGKDNNLNSVASGIYFVQLETNKNKYLQKIMYMK